MPRTTVNNWSRPKVIHDDFVNAIAEYVRFSERQRLAQQMGELFGHYRESHELGELLAKTGVRVRIVECYAPHVTHLTDLRKRWEQPPPVKWPPRAVAVYQLKRGKTLLFESPYKGTFVDHAIKYLRARAALGGGQLA